MPFYDEFRLRFQVPCGRCRECLSHYRNDWFVRLASECKDSRYTYFVTWTLSPSTMAKYGENPASFVREVNRRLYNDSYVRGVGRKAHKHFIVSEYGKTTHRLHFHGILFGRYLDFRHFHELFADFGWTWIESASRRTCRYVLKYLMKDFTVKRFEGKSFQCTEQIEPGRVYASPGLGRNLVTYNRDVQWYDHSISLRGFSRKFKKVVNYVYRIPRYYFRKLSDFDRAKRWFFYFSKSSSPALLYALQHSQDLLLRCFAYFDLQPPRVLSPARGSTKALFQLSLSLGESTYREKMRVCTDYFDSVIRQFYGKIPANRQPYQRALLV